MTTLKPAGRSATPSLVAVAVPLSNRMVFTEEEEISLWHLHHHLGQFDRFFIIPESQDIDVSGFKIKRFSPAFFGSVRACRGPGAFPRVGRLDLVAAGLPVAVLAAGLPLRELFTQFVFSYRRARRVARPEVGFLLMN